ncbi:MAG TPA: large-conductance mechanosensitive channel protein MscL [Pseudomonadales bacterium]|nr:large-conductance mechanosensitive channel protein MscL [Pseudomonadales bacterium]
MKILNEFKEFAIKGNVVDMAVGVIIGAAFGKIVTALVSQVVMPPIGFLLGSVDFSSLSIVLKEKTDTAAAVSINYGLFINTVIDFTIVAFVIFILVKQINRFKKEAEVSTKECPKCISVISIKATRCPHCTSEI